MDASSMASFVDSCADMHGRANASVNVHGRLFHISEWAEAALAALRELGQDPFYPEPLTESVSETNHRRLLALMRPTDAAFMRDFFCDEFRLAYTMFIRTIRHYRPDNDYYRVSWGLFRRFMLLDWKV